MRKPVVSEAFIYMRTIILNMDGEFYDMHVACDDIDMIKELGFKGACTFSDREPKHLEGFDVFRGIEIEASNMADLKRVALVRKNFDVVLVNAREIDILRKAVRVKDVDVVHVGTKEGVIDHIIAKDASANKTFIEFRLSDMLNFYANHRARIFRNLVFNAKMIKKYSTPFVITSGAREKWELRGVGELIAFAVALGFQPNEAKAGLQRLSELIKIRKSKGYVADGIIVEDKK